MDDTFDIMSKAKDTKVKLNEGFFFKIMHSELNEKAV